MKTLIEKWSKEIVAEFNAYTQMLTISPEIPGPSKEFVRDALYGLLRNQSVVVSRIAQALREPIPVLYREQRLSYQLSNDRWDPLSGESTYLDWVSHQLHPDTVISVDMGDISKKYARKMPGIGIIWDGSDKKTARGYSLIEMEGIQPDGKHLPIYLDVLSTQKTSYVSQNHQINSAIDFVLSHIGPVGIWVMDRGADDEKRFKFFDERKVRWVIRVRGDRLVERTDLQHLKAQSIARWAHRVHPIFDMTIKTNGKAVTFKGGSIPICLPDQPDVTYYLTVVWSSRKRPWYLMSNIPIATAKDFQKVVLAYVRRWGVEDGARVIKQAFDLENIRLLTFDGIRKMVWLTLWAYGFLCLIGRWPVFVLNLLLSKVPALVSWRKLKIIHYRVAMALSEVLALSPPASSSTKLSEEVIFA